jgi:hypothetical protein
MPENPFLAAALQVKFSNVTMYVYAGNDIVSEALKGKGHGWEGNEVKEMLWAVRQYWKQGEAMKYLAGAKAQPADTFVVGGGSTGRHLLQEQQQQGPQQRVSQQWQQQQQQGRTLLAEGSIVAQEDSYGSRNLLQKQSRASQQWNQQRINNQRRRQEGRRGYSGDRRHLLHANSLQQGHDLLDEGSILVPVDSSGSRSLLQKQSRASKQWDQQRINNQRRRQEGNGGGDRRHLLHGESAQQGDFLDEVFDLAYLDSSSSRNLLQKQSRASQQWNQQRINNQRRRQEGSRGYGGDRRHLLHGNSLQQGHDLLDRGYYLATVDSSGSRSLLQKQSRASKQWDQQRINNQRRRQEGNGGGDRRHLLHEQSLQQGRDPLEEGSILAPVGRDSSRSLLQKQSQASKQWDQQRINNQRRRQGRNLLEVLGGPSKALQASSSSSSSSKPSRPLMVDVGGNVGWFTINAAAAGARVATFEGMHMLLLAGHSLRQWRVLLRAVPGVWVCMQLHLCALASSLLLLLMLPLLVLPAAPAAPDAPVVPAVVACCCSCVHLLHLQRWSQTWRC